MPSTSVRRRSRLAPGFVAAALCLAGAAAHAQEVQEGPLPALNRSPTQTSPTSPAPGTQIHQNARDLDNDAVIRMTRAEVGEAIVLQAVRTQPGTYRTGPDDLIALKQAGVSERVISAMLARNSGMAQHVPLRQVEVAPLSPEVDDPGVYWKNKQGQWEPVSPELVNYRSGGATKSVLTRGIVRPDRNGKVAGPKSSLPLQPGTEMLILAPFRADPVEFVILRLREKSDRREFRVESGSFFHTETGSDRDRLDLPVHKISPRLFSFTIPADLQKGQYGVLPPGSANASGISFAGKIYTFSINE